MLLGELCESALEKNTSLPALLTEFSETFVHKEVLKNAYYPQFVRRQEFANAKTLVKVLKQKEQEALLGAGAAEGSSYSRKQAKRHRQKQKKAAEKQKTEQHQVRKARMQGKHDQQLLFTAVDPRGPVDFRVC